MKCILDHINQITISLLNKRSPEEEKLMKPQQQPNLMVIMGTVLVLMETIKLLYIYNGFDIKQLMAHNDI